MDALKKPPHRQALPLISIVTFLGFLDTHLLIPVLALYVSELGAGIAITGLIIGLYSLTNTPANIFFGGLIDRIGYKLPLVSGLIGDALTMFLYSISRLPIHLALVRVLHGTTGALIGPATMSAMAVHSTEDRKGKMMSFYGIAIAAATLVGYGLSGVLASRLGYAAVFQFGAAMLLAGVILTLWLPGGRQNSSVPRASFAESFNKVKGLFKKRGLVITYASIFAQYFTFGGVVTLLPLHVKSLGMEAFHVGMLLALFAVMFIIFQFPAGAFSDRRGRLIPTVCGLSLSAVALLILPSVSSFPLLALTMALYGAAYGILFPSISALLVDHTTPEERGLATGIFHALLTAGVAVGAPVIGWVGEVVGIETGLMVSSGVIILAIVTVLRAARRI